MRYLIGVDLGTTNSCVSYIDTDSEKNPTLSVQPFSIPQLIGVNQMGTQKTLPSFCYLAEPGELQSKAMDVVGAFAKELGAKVPSRLVESAKSWLCHAATHRKDRILPIEAADEKRRMSPIEATRRYLQHLKEVWNQKHPEFVWEEQLIILTVPASFDETARKYTVEAAEQAGYKNLTILEEPQAAFYSWIQRHEKNWCDFLDDGDRILVCDVGGGTTDFSLIDVSKKDAEASFQRMAVGQHLLLGGDNMDAVLAKLIQDKLKTNRLSWNQIRLQARLAKEQLFSQEKDPEIRLVLQGTGSRIVANTHTVTLTKEEAQEKLTEIFFFPCHWKEAKEIKPPQKYSLGLPYQEELSICKHLAQFLSRHRSKAPKHILFNGGAMKPQCFRNAVLDAMRNLYPNETIGELPSVSFDQSVAKGAAYYGKVRQGLGIRIRGGSPRAFYIEMDGRALTLLPRGVEEGKTHVLEHPFQVTPNCPMSFRLFESHIRLHDKMGDYVDLNEEEFQPLPPVVTQLRFGKKGQKEALQVQMEVFITTVGTLEIGLKSQISEHYWNLPFQIRGVDGSDSRVQREKVDELFDVEHLMGAKQIIFDTYRGQRFKPNSLMDALESNLDQKRNQWSPSLLRGLWPSLVSEAKWRNVSQDHESRWWHLAGFILRPGFGYPLDDHRIKELWQQVLFDSGKKDHKTVEISRWICMRRIAGGLNPGQQKRLASEALKQTSADEYLYSERIRALASFEFLDRKTKIQLARACIEKVIQGKASKAETWAIGRIGSRRLAYGSLAHVIPKEEAEKWIEKLLLAASGTDLKFPLRELAIQTECPEINVSGHYVEQVEADFPNSDYSTCSLEFMGDQLPPGLRLIT